MSMKHFEEDQSGYDQQTFESVAERLKPGDLSYDVGAYDAITSAKLAKVVGAENVVIIEPGEMNWATIRAYWAAHNFPAPRATYCGFLNDEDRFGVIPARLVNIGAFPVEADKNPYVSYNEEGLNFRVLEDRTKYPEVGAIPWIKLDSLAHIVGEPKGIIMDVEGAELQVLKGAEKTLRNAKPLVWASVHPKHMPQHFNQTTEMLHNYMRGVGYRGTLLADDHEQHWLFEPEAL